MYPIAVLLTGIFIFVSIKPVIADYYHRRAQSNKNDTQYATRNTQYAIKLDSTNAKYHYELAKLYTQYAVGDTQYLQSALNAYKKAVELNPSNSKYHQSLAWAYGQLADIVSQSHKATKLLVKQKRVDAIRNMNFAYQEFQDAINLEPNNPHRHRTYALWLFNHPTKENIENGVMEYKKAIELNPKLAKEALERYLAVEKKYRRLKTILPDAPEDHYKVMSMLLDAGLWGQNEADFKEDMEKASYKYPYYKAISRYYAKNKDIKKSIEVLEDYLKIDPNCADAHFYIADRMLYIKPLNWSKIFQHHERALTLDPDNTFYREWYARYLFHAKRYNEAVTQLERVLEKDSWNVNLHRLLGDWYKRVGRTKDAKRAYDKVQKLSEAPELNK